MPLYGKNPFIRQKPPADIKPNDKVFHCKLTNEVFKNYDEYFARVILCNSLVWSCSVTGRPGLTFQDALNSEEQALETLAGFPAGLKRPLLLLASLTQRGRLADLCDDVFTFARDRYFVGEQVQVTIRGCKKSCTVTGVSTGKATSPQKKGGQPLAADKLKYQVTDAEGKTHQVAASDVCRKKNSYTRDKNRIFFRQTVELRDGTLKVKEATSHKYGLEQMSFAEVFTGPAPTFSASPRANQEGKPKKAKQTTPKKEGSPKKEVPAEKKEPAAKPQPSSKMSDNEMEDLLRLKMAQMEARKEKLQRKHEEKRLYAQFLNEWNRAREDLECDDLRELPPMVALQCFLPPESFGDCLLVLEFLSLFARQLELKDYFPGGVTFEVLERALTEVDVLGPLSDLFQMLLTAVLRAQEDDTEPNEADEEDSDEEDTSSLSGAQRVATATARKQQQALGLRLSEVTLDALSLSEVLRLHLASSGSLSLRKRGWCSSQREDPGLWFVLQEPQIMARLATGSFHDLDVGEKVKLLRVLVEQLLSMESYRGVIEESMGKLKQLKQELRQLRLLSKQDKDEPKKKKLKEGPPEPDRKSVV